MSFREPEPEAHCYNCGVGEHARKGEQCNEYKSLNPHYEGGYDRRCCLWGSHVVKQARLENSPAIQKIEAMRTHLLRTKVTYEEWSLVQALALEVAKEAKERLEKMKK